jgi:hypothetical protein
MRSGASQRDAERPAACLDVAAVQLAKRQHKIALGAGSPFKDAEQRDEDQQW